VFQGSLAVAIIMIDGSEKPNRQLGFELQSSHVIENRNKSNSDMPHKILVVYGLEFAKATCEKVVLRYKSI